MRTALILGTVAAFLMACSTASAAWYVGPVKVVTPTKTIYYGTTYYGPTVTVRTPPLIAPAPAVRIPPPPAPVIVRPRPARRAYFYLW